MAQRLLVEEEVVSRCLVVQHLEPEGSYAIGEALSSAGVDVEPCRVFTGDSVPTDASGFDGVVVMGGPMSATSDDGFGSRRAEIELLTNALDQGVPTLGVCLGAQLLALAAGGSVLTGSAGPEIGWGSVDLTEAARSDPLLGGLPSRLTVLHWHNDTFGLPPGGTQLAASRLYPQAYRVGERAWGFQFHVEVDRQAVTAFLDAFGGEAREAGSDTDDIDGQTAACLGRLGPIRDRIADRFAGLVSGFDRDEDLVELG
jgi:GMP synthase-like glutamine amidotransferase